jgi:hypothetical protein
VANARWKTVLRKTKYQVDKKGKKMENQIVCPHCKKTISNNPVIEDAAKGEGSDSQTITCDCGERITYWQITAQLREQKTTGRKFKNWVGSLFHGGS